MSCRPTDAFARKITDDDNVKLELDQLVKSVPTTSTFHHLGHEGKVFIHSDRHYAIPDGGTVDYLIIIPAGDSARQVHTRFNVIGKAITGSLDADIILYKDSTVSANGSVEPIVSSNDAVIKTTDVTIFEGPTITDVGSQKAWTMITGEKKSAGSLDQIVPEWILAPNGDNARNYIIRVANNSGGDMDIVTSIFFYDSKAI